MSTEFAVSVTQELYIVINDPNVIDRVLQNQDDEGVPQERKRGGSGWRDHFYDLRSEEEVVEMIASAYALYRSEINSLDGWADLPASAVTYEDICTETLVEAD